MKVEKQLDDLPPNPKKEKKDILWKFLQQKQRLLQTPALVSALVTMKKEYLGLRRVYSTSLYTVYVDTSLYFKEVGKKGAAILVPIKESNIGPP